MHNMNLDFLFHPRSIAIAGASGTENKFNAGLKFLEGLLAFGYKGKIYPISPGGGEVLGLKIYKNIKDIPGQVDYVISAIPAQYTPQLVADASSKGVKAIHFFTSGFSEIESRNGEKLQKEIIKIARRAGIRIIGPNCLGIYCPAGGMTFNPDISKQSGPVGMISQSGGNAAHCIHEANSRGIYFSKVISMGNGADLNESDFLEYLIDDPDTKIITAYIEGVRQGPRFLKALKAAARVKPVIIFKVGNSEVGAEAAASHTTAMAGSSRIWEGLLKQVGAIQVNSIEEMVDVTAALLHMPAPAGKNAAVIGIGGGASVIAADEFINAGLELPRLSLKVRQGLLGIQGSEAGRIFKNPVDVNNFEGPEKFLLTVKAIEACDNVDFLVIQVAYDHFGLISATDKEFLTSVYIYSIVQLKDKVDKPIAIILHSFSANSTRKLAAESYNQLAEAGFTVFLSIPRAAVALSKYIDYCKWLKSHRTGTNKKAAK
ncbi:MAG: CoA-binding protein [Dehalococcoidia bacterium]|nr:CoA-binding protein [Dehalococcoidia bacterium]MDD5494093.1 CoA-binding protein [Dehalococcoidia bacterium]